MENDEFYTVDVADLEMQDEEFISSDLESNLTEKRVAFDADVMTSTGMEEPYMFGNEMQNKKSAGDSTHIILYVVIVICVVVGIALGILAGRKAAYK